MRLLCTLLVLACVAGCGGERGGRQRSDDATDGFIARATVLEDASHGPQLCLGGVADSYPPQCGGPDLIGWDWATTGDFERSGKARWGDYVVIGTYDATTNAFTLTRRPVPPAKYKGRPPSVSESAVQSTPCKKPPGGWKAVDPGRTTERTMEQTFRRAEARRDFGGLWLDQSINPASRGETTEDKEMLLNDPAKLVLNVAVTGNLVEAETDLRKVWGGALCVSRSEHTARELRKIQDEITRRSDHWLSVGSGHDVVDVQVVWDDGSRQRTYDRRYGRGMVKVSSALQPLSRLNTITTNGVSEPH